MGLDAEHPHEAAHAFAVDAVPKPEQPESQLARAEEGVFQVGLIDQLEQAEVGLGLRDVAVVKARTGQADEIALAGA
jgi:hypothetical protein